MCLNMSAVIPTFLCLVLVFYMSPSGCGVGGV